MPDNQGPPRPRPKPLARPCSELSDVKLRLNAVRDFVRSDAIAISYQSLGQYRTEILRLLNK